MLQSMREGAKKGLGKFILLGLLALGAGGLVLTDVGGFFRGGISAGDVAKVDGFELSLPQFDKSVRLYLQQDYMTPQEAYRMGLIDTILQNEINARLLTQDTFEKGLVVSNEEVTRQIANLTEGMAVTEESRKVAVQRMLRERGISEGEFIAAIRQETAITLLRDALTGGTALVPTPLLKDLYLYENEKRDVALVHLKDESITDITEPTEENLQKYYQANRAFYAIPETRDVTIATLLPESLEDVQISDEAAEAEYEANKISFELPETRTLDQIIVKEEDDAQALFDLIQDGKSLEEAAKTLDKGKANYLEQQDYEETGLVPEIADPAFAADIGDIIGPVETPLGFHILKLHEITDVTYIPFADVKEDIKNQMKQEKLDEGLYETANAMDDMVAAGDALDTIVQEYNLTTENYSGFRESGLNTKDEDVFKSFNTNRLDILEVAFELEEGEIAPVMEMADGRFVLIRLNGITPLGYKEFDTVKKEIEEKWIAEQKKLENKVRAETAYKNLQDGTKKLSDVDTLKTYKGLTRKDNKDSPLSNSAMSQLFDLQEGQYFMSPVPGGFVIGLVQKISIPDPDKVEEKELANIKNRAGKIIPNEIVNRYVKTVSDSKDIKINRGLLERTYGTESAF